MNIFDFDDTIYRGNSMVDFYFYLLPRHPGIVIYLPKQLYAVIRYYVFHKGSKTECKAMAYSFLKLCKAQSEVDAFWDKKLSRLKAFYLQMKSDDDVIVSASPEFLLKPLEQRLGIHVIASPISPVDGSALGENCYYEEKVRRLTEHYSVDDIESFYSDSLSDEPLAKLAGHAYLVKGDQILDWDFSKHKKKIHI